MSNLNNNTAQLEALLVKANSLPSANNVPNVDQATPTITVDSSTGLITATATQTAGYVAAGTKSATNQLAFKAATTITPGTTNQTAVSANTYVGGAITVKGDANLVASNIVSGKSIFGVVGTATAGGGGDTDAEDSLVTRRVVSYTNDRVTTIGSYAFEYCTSLTTVNFPKCTTINSVAFSRCGKLTTLSFPEVTYIGASAFTYCSVLTTANFPKCSSIASYVFANCPKLATLSFPELVNIGSNAFAYCSIMTTASFPKCSKINANAFNKCYNLKSLYLMGSSVCSLASTTAFSSTPIGGYSTSAGTYGSIYVPASLLTAYQSASDWKTLSSRFVGI